MLRSIPPSIYGVCIHSQSLRRCRCTYFICQFKRLGSFFCTVFFCHLSIAPYKNVFYHFLAISDCTFIVSLHLHANPDTVRIGPLRGVKYMTVYSFDKSYAMLEEARKVIPNGIYGPRTPSFLTYGSYPCFLARGKGSHIWDVDGNEYIDYMCSFGTNILGICNEEVDQAAMDQMKKGDCFTLPSNRWNEMAEYMVNLIEGQDWVVFGKNGSDVTSFATTVARGYTGKNKIILANGAYHGAHFWCTHSEYGIPKEYQELSLIHISEPTRRTPI